MPSVFLFGGGGTATASGSGTEGALPVFDSAGALADSPLTLDSVSSPTTLTALKIDAVVSADSADVVDGSLIDSPLFRFRGWLDSDVSAGVTASSRDIDLYHEVAAISGQGASSLVGDYEGTEYFRIVYMGSGRPRFQGTAIDVRASSGTLGLYANNISFLGAGGGQLASFEPFSSPTRLHWTLFGGRLLQIDSGVGDSATAEAFVFNSLSTLSTTGAELAAFYNNGTHKVSIDKDGNIDFGANLFAGGIYWPNTGGTPRTFYIKRTSFQLEFEAQFGTLFNQQITCLNAVTATGFNFQTGGATMSPANGTGDFSNTDTVVLRINTTFFNASSSNETQPYHFAGNFFMLNSKGTIKADGEKFDSQKLRFRAQYDSDDSASFANSSLDCDIYHNLVTEGSSPISRLVFEIGGAEKLALHNDGGLEVQSLVKAQSTVSLTADDQVVATTGASYIQLSSDDGTATNRTFVLDQGDRTGHILTLEWSGTNAAELVDDSAVNGGGNHRLASTWLPTQYDTITLIWNGTDWIELNRATN